MTIDPGAAHNVVSLEEVRELGRLVTGQAISVFPWVMNNDEPIKGIGVFEQVMPELEGGVTVVEDFLRLG